MVQQTKHRTMPEVEVRKSLRRPKRSTRSAQLTETINFMMVFPPFNWSHRQQFPTVLKARWRSTHWHLLVLAHNAGAFVDEV